MTRAQLPGGRSEQAASIVFALDQVTQWQTSIPDRAPLTVGVVVARIFSPPCNPRSNFPGA